MDNGIAADRIKALPGIDLPPGNPHERQALVTTVISALRSLPRWGAAALIVLLTISVGWADMVSSAEVSLFVFYALPIALSVSVLGTRAGIATSLFAAVVWWIVNRLTNMYATEAGYLIAVGNRLFYFGVVVVAVAVTQKKQQADAARIRALEERRRLERELVRVSEREQQRIGQDLHDGLCQSLAAIGCAARMLADDLEAKDLPESNDASMIETAIQEAILEARSLARGIFPVHVDSDSLPAALEELAKTMSRLTGGQITVRGTEVEINVEPTVAMHLYRIAQEAVANAARHSGASSISVLLRVLPSSDLELRIEDNGKGLHRPSDQPGGGMGLSTMRYRAEALGGRFEVGPRPGGGTVVSCRVAIPAKRAVTPRNQP